MHLVQAQPAGHVLPHRLGVAGEHDGLAHASRFEGGHGLLRVGLHLVGDDDVAQVHPVGGHVDGGAHPVAGVPGHADVLHQLVVAGADGVAVHHGLHAPAGHLLHVGHPGGIHLPAVGLL